MAQPDLTSHHLQHARRAVPAGPAGEKLDAAIRSEMRRAAVPGLSVAVTRADRLLHRKGFGLADVAAPEQATPDTAYLWFSLSKIATATVVMALAEAGRLDVDAPVRTYVPGYPSRTGPTEPTVRQLLSHTAGLANPLPLRWVRPADAPAPDPAAFLAPLLRRHGRPRHAIGGPTHYSNLGYLLLARIVEVVTGEAFPDHVTRTLLQPLQMHRTSYTRPADAPVATGYLKAPRLVSPVLRAALPSGILGPRVAGYQSFRPFLVDGPGYGGLVGPVTDAVRLAALHLGDGILGGRRILSADAARRMRTLAARGRRIDVGLGWFRPAAQRHARPFFVEHLGGGLGYVSIVRVYPDLDLAIGLMANTTRGLDHDAICAVAAAADWTVHDQRDEATE